MCKSKSENKNETEKKNLGDLVLAGPEDVSTSVIFSCVGHLLLTPHSVCVCVCVLVLKLI